MDINQSFLPPRNPRHVAIAVGIAFKALLVQTSRPGCLWPFALKYVINTCSGIQDAAIETTPHIEILKCEAHSKTCQSVCLCGTCYPASFHIQVRGKIS